MTLRVMIAGGGTGGHLFPAIALAQELVRVDPQTEALFVGTARGIEVRAVPKAGFELELLPVSGLRRVGPLRTISGLLRLPLALLRAARLVCRFQPNVAVSVGGYAAGPAVLAARLLGVPCVVMEQNAVAGFTNRVLSRLATRVIAAVPVRGIARTKQRLLGNPVRADLMAVRQQPYEVGQPYRLFVFGGSQGARALNNAMIAAAPRLGELGVPLHVLHQTGSADHGRVQEAYRSVVAASSGNPPVSFEAAAFIDDMASAYGEADLLLCRSGATSIAELTLCGRPAILVPYPFAVDDHQTQNARGLASAGAAVHLPQTELNVQRLLELLGDLLSSAQRLQSMAAASHALGKPGAATDIATEIRAVASNRGRRRTSASEAGAAPGV